MATGPVHSAHQHLLDALASLAAATSEDELLSVLTVCEGIARRLDHIAASAVAALDDQGAFASRGYRSAVPALVDLLGIDRPDAHRRVTAAQQVCPRTTLTGESLPPRLPALAAVFTDGHTTLRHVDAAARALHSAAAGRLAHDTWAGAEAAIAAHAHDYTPAQLHTWATALVETLDADGAHPDDTPPPPVNELRLTRNPTGSGGRLKGRFDDPALYDAIATVLDAKAAPLTADDHRTSAQRQADALADVCGYVLDHADLPHSGGHRPHLTVTVRLDDLENRARSASLDLGGTLTPAALRTLACDARVIPVVLGGAGQPLDVGRTTRTIPDGLRRAVAARDLGCAHPGCDRPPSWSEVHHIVEWEHGGPTTIDNLVMLCRAHHRQIHHTDWIVRIRDGLPEFVPPRWIDPRQTPRRTALPYLVA